MALALLLWAPQGISHGEQTVITGHSTFYNGDTFDPCLGSIAGIMRSRVMWFNDQVLVERYGGKGTFVYVTENGADDPRERQLRSEGVFYDFVDPNGAHWHVTEAYMAEGISGEFYVNDDPIGNDDDPIARVSTAKDRTYVWIVELAARPIYDEFAGDDPHTYYNFLTLVDTCKFNEDVPMKIEDHNNESGLLNDRNGHANGEKEHQHESYLVQLWVGKQPTIIVGGASTEGAQWQSEWATAEAGGEANDASGGAYNEVTE